MLWHTTGNEKAFFFLNFLHSEACNTTSVTGYCAVHRLAKSGRDVVLLNCEVVIPGCVGSLHAAGQ